MRARVLIAAGGTGGHLFPAEALATALARRGWDIHLATDDRAQNLGASFPGSVHVVRSATVSGRRGVAVVGAVLKMVRGIAGAYSLVWRLNPDVAIGFGGYPTVPPVFAARLAGVPVVIHEQNAVLGRANRVLARFATVIATSHQRVTGMAAGGRIVETGNPVREAVRDAAALPYQPPEDDGPFRLLVFGGSQGARYFSDALPAAIGLLDPALRARLVLTQQCRPDDVDRVKAAYSAAGVEAEVAAFFADLPARIAASHLVVSRSGASTVAELAAIGRPAIMVPLPNAIDQDQKANAASLSHGGAGWTFAEAELDPARLAREISELAAAPRKLAAAAAAARSLGRGDAAERLAALVESIVAERKGEKTS